MRKLLPIIIGLVITSSCDNTKEKQLSDQLILANIELSRKVDYQKTVLQQHYTEDPLKVKPWFLKANVFSKRLTGLTKQILISKDSIHAFIKEFPIAEEAVRHNLVSMAYDSLMFYSAALNYRIHYLQDILYHISTNFCGLTTFIPALYQVGNLKLCMIEFQRPGLGYSLPKFTITNDHKIDINPYLNLGHFIVPKDQKDTIKGSINFIDGSNQSVRHIDFSVPPNMEATILKP